MARYFLLAALVGLVAACGARITRSPRLGARSCVPPSRRRLMTPPYRAGLSPSAAALRRARWWRLQAQARVARQREAVESWDLKAGEQTGRREWNDWCAQMAQDPDGSLRRAEGAAREAVAHARSLAETYRATETLALIERDRGDHPAELRAARRLMVLDPENELSRYWLRHAARCTIGLPRPVVGRDGGRRRRVVGAGPREGVRACREQVSQPRTPAGP